MEEIENKSLIHAGHRKRMREKFARNGGAGFQKHEILEMVLYSSIPRGNTNEIAHALINKFGSFSGVLNAPYEELLKVKGVGEASALAIKMIPVCCKIYFDERYLEGTTFTDIRKVGQYLLNIYAMYDKEFPSAVLYDARRKEIDWITLGEPGTSSSSIDANRLIRECVSRNASYVVLAHNHPSGIAIPSQEDIIATKKIIALLSTIDCRLVDHIILGRKDFVSLYQSAKTKHAFDQLPKSSSKD